MPARSSKRPPRRPYVVRTSRIHGRGVFAADTIRKGTPIIEYKGERVAWDEAVTRPDSDPDNPFHTFFFSLDDGRVIDANVGGNAARWINHSCDPNCETEETDDERIMILAMRDIGSGEELTYDYRLKIDDKLSKREFAHFTCRCGAPACRGTMLAGKKHERRAKKLAGKAEKKRRKAEKKQRKVAKRERKTETATDPKRGARAAATA